MDFLSYFYNNIMAAEIMIGAIMTVAAIVIFYIMCNVSLKSGSQEIDLKKRLIEAGVLDRNPEMYIKLDALQREYALLSGGIKWGWVPFLLFVYAFKRESSVSIDAQSFSFSSILPICFIVGLAVFYALLLRRAMTIHAKISSTEAELFCKTGREDKNG